MRDSGLDTISDAAEPSIARRTPSHSLETLMNYPVLTAGLVLAPRGFGTMLTMVIAGQLLRHIDPRLLIAVGLGITGLALYLMTGFTPDVSQGTLIRTGLVHGFGIGCVFVPLGTVAFGTLPPALRTQGTGLFNLMRNIGASIGISMMSYLPVRNSATEQAALVEHITPYRQVVRDFAHQLNLATLGGRAALTQMVAAQGGRRRVHRQFQTDDVCVLSGDPAGNPGTASAVTPCVRACASYARGFDVDQGRAKRG